MLSRKLMSVLYSSACSHCHLSMASIPLGHHGAQWSQPGCRATLPMGCSVATSVSLSPLSAHSTSRAQCPGQRASPLLPGASSAAYCLWSWTKRTEVTQGGVRGGVTSGFFLGFLLSPLTFSSCLLLAFLNQFDLPNNFFSRLPSFPTLAGLLMKPPVFAACSLMCS